MAENRIKAGVIGGTGYTGVELLRLLATHPAAELTVVTSRSEAGKPLADVFPNLRNHVELSFTEPGLAVLGDCDVVFFATPNGTAMTMVPELLEAGVRVIDLAADFRLKDADVWQQWYGLAHACPELLAEAVYGLPEVNRADIATARLVANPGCYPTAVQLGFLPLIKHDYISLDSLVVDAKSGVSGAGRKAMLASMFCEAGENFKAYGVDGHRHLPEIKQGLAALAGQEPGVTFVPHLVPMVRGIHATLYANVKDASKQGIDLQQLFETCFEHEPFVDVLAAGSHPETRSVKASNVCRLAVHRPQGGDIVVVLSVIDNLVKGAAGQAVQNMNIMFGIEESQGLTDIAILP